MAHKADSDMVYGAWNCYILGAFAVLGTTAWGNKKILKFLKKSVDNLSKFVYNSQAR